MTTVEKYLQPDVIRQISRLDLRAQFVVKGFLHGLHASPFHGFSVEFSEHRKYTPGDDPKDLDWLVYAKTDKYYIKKFEAETNITGYLVVDSSRSMGYTFRQKVTKFEYAISLAAALCYLMIQQQDPVGLITFDTRIRNCVAPKSKRSQLGTVLSLLARLQPAGETDFGHCLTQLAAMLRQHSLIMIFSDLLADADVTLPALRRLRHGGHDVIVFQVLDEAEASFPFTGAYELQDPESEQTIAVDADAFRKEYLRGLAEFRGTLQRECAASKIDFIPLDTSMPFDRALTEYLLSRRGRR